MKLKSWMKYTVYIFIIYVLIFLNEYLTAYMEKEFIINFYIFAIIMLINIIIGLLLGLENLVNQKNIEGNWRVNWPKITLLGLPSLYFSLTYFLCYSKNEFIHGILTYPLIVNFFKYGSCYVSIFQLLLGYVVITSLYKDNKKI